MVKRNLLILEYIFRTYIAQSASSWIDDYYDWSTIDTCCKYFPKNDSFCPHNFGNFKYFIYAFMISHS